MEKKEIKERESEENSVDLDDEDTQKDKFLTFKIASEDYAVAIRFVTEIIGILKITEVPDTPHFVRGVINLRGKIIPVIDVRSRFNLDEKAYGDRTCIIVVNIHDTSTGLIVDEVSEVTSIPENQISAPPKAGKTKNNQFVEGIGKVGDCVKIILDTDKLLNIEQAEDLKDLSQVKAA